MSDIKAKEAIKTLEKMGYTVKISKPSVKKTFEVAIDLLEEFTHAQKKNNIRMKDAISEALSDWVKKRG